MHQEKSQSSSELLQSLEAREILKSQEKQTKQKRPVK